MSHKFETGFFAGQPAWHNLGTVVKDCQTVREAFKLSELDWDVVLRSIYLADGSEITTHKVTIRESDNSILGVVPATYVPFQNSQAFDFLDATVANGEAIFETAGSLDNGKKIFVLCKLPTAIEIAKNDVIDPYFLACNSHDATLAIRIFPTATRVVCWNTCSAAINAQKEKESTGTALGLNVRHTKRMAERIEQGKHTIRGIVEAYRLFANNAKLLQSKAIKNDKELVAYFDSIFTPPNTPETESKEQLIQKIQSAAKQQSSDYLELINRLANWKDVSSVQERHYKERLITLQDIFHNQRNEGLVGATYWAAFNTITEYVDHHRNTRGANDAQRREAKFNSVVFGPGNTLKTNAFETALSLAS